jgi:hypothetical protein
MVIITILDIIHRPVFYLKQDVSQTGLRLRFRVVPTQSRETDNSSTY